MSSNEKYVRKWCESAGKSFEDLSSSEKLEAYCEWRLGDPGWADGILEAAEEFGVITPQRTINGT